MSSRVLGTALVAAACALAASVPDALGQSAPVEVVASLPGADVGSDTLVGSSGQLYVRDPERPVWRRESIGGVAVSVRGAARGPGGDIFLAGGRTPLFRRAGGAWHASPLANRGSTSLGDPSGIPVLAVGRHVYLARSGRWHRRTSSNRTITEIWARSPRELYAADERGGLRRFGGSWASVRLSLSAGDRVVELTGDATYLYLRSQAGIVARVSKTTAKPLQTGPALGRFTPQRLAPTPKGGLWVVGEANDGTNSRLVLARLEKTTLTLSEPLPVIDAGDRVAVLRADAAGGLLVVTQRGGVHIRAADGTWSRGQVSGELPPSATRVFDAAPARSR